MSEKINILTKIGIKAINTHLRKTETKKYWQGAGDISIKKKEDLMILLFLNTNLYLTTKKNHFTFKKLVFFVVFLSINEKFN